MSSLAVFGVLGGGTAMAVDGSLPGQNTVGSEDIIQGEVKSGDIKDGGVTFFDIGANQVLHHQVKDNTLTGADIDESALGKVPSAANADTLDGKNADQLASGRIHVSGDTGGLGVLFPGLGYSVGCYSGSVEVAFNTDEFNGTANAMIIASGVEQPTSFPETINVANGAQNSGYPFILGRAADVSLSNASGDAAAEMQLIIDAGARTYSVALHIYHRASDHYCEVLGTATLAD